MYGEDAVTDQMYQKWFVTFHARDFSLKDALPSGRPVEVDSDQIKALAENNQNHTTQEIANILIVSKSSVENHLHQLGYVNQFDTWGLHKQENIFLTIFLQVIFYLNMRKPFCS